MKSEYRMLLLGQPRVILDVVVLQKKDAKHVEIGRAVSFNLGSQEIEGKISKLLSPTQIEVVV